MSLVSSTVQNQRMIDFRPAIEEDLPLLHSVWWAADPFDAFNNNSWFGHVIRTGSMMVATSDRRPVGFAGFARSQAPPWCPIALSTQTIRGREWAPNSFHDWCPTIVR